MTLSFLWWPWLDEVSEGVCGLGFQCWSCCHQSRPTSWGFFSSGWGDWWPSHLEKLLDKLSWSEIWEKCSPFRRQMISLNDWQPLPGRIFSGNCFVYICAIILNYSHYIYAHEPHAYWKYEPSQISSWLDLAHYSSVLHITPFLMLRHDWREEGGRVGGAKVKAVLTFWLIS